MYVCLFVCIYGCLIVCLFDCVFVCMYVCLYICIFVCLFICICICICKMYVCMYIVCVYMCIYQNTKFTFFAYYLMWAPADYYLFALRIFPMCFFSWKYFVHFAKLKNREMKISWGRQGQCTAARRRLYVI